MRKASQQPNPSLASRPSHAKRKHSEVEEDTPTTGGRGLFSTIKKFIRGNAVKVTSSLIASNYSVFYIDLHHINMSGAPWIIEILWFNRPVYSFWHFSVLILCLALCSPGS